MRLRTFLAIGCLVLGCAHAAPTVRLGMSTALTGPTSALGIAGRDGVLAALREINAGGGIRGAQLELIALDDGYEPTRTLPNMRTLIHEERVLAVVGNLGAPCAVVAVPVANESGTVLFGYITGGAVLRRTPPDRVVFNFRPSLAQEVSALVDGFVTGGIAPEDIAFFTQRDAFGDSAFAGGVQALQRNGLNDTSRIRHVRYERNTLNIESGLSELLLHSSPPKAIVFGGATQPLIALVRSMKATDYSPLLGTVSFVNATEVADAAGSDAEGVIVTQVVPPVDGDSPAAVRFRTAIAAVAPEQARSFIAFEAYCAMMLLAEGLRRSEDLTSREALAAALTTLGTVDLGLGVPLMFGIGRHQASDTLWPTRIQQGEVRLLQWRELAMQPAAAP